MSTATKGKAEKIMGGPADDSGDEEEKIGLLHKESRDKNHPAKMSGKRNLCLHNSRWDGA